MLRKIFTPEIRQVGDRTLEMVISTNAPDRDGDVIEPNAWLAPAATGSPEQCAVAIRGQLDLGCDGVILHGATPAELAPIVAAYRER